MDVERIIRFFKDWALPVSMLAGVGLYFAAKSLHLPPCANRFLIDAVGVVQPVLLFSMLFVSFCKINPLDLRLKRWHLWAILVQSAGFAAFAVATAFTGNADLRVVFECGMLCMICPTATAAAVVTDKLGGNTLTLVAYTIAINLVVAVLVPLVVPLVYPEASTSFFQAFGMIIAKVFPMLVLPFALAWLVRLCMPRLHARIVAVRNLAFYMWVVALMFALAVTTRALVNSRISVACVVGIAAVTLAGCLLQFVVGKRIGSAFGDRISGGQAMGQKNTVFMIWMGYAFLNPVTAVAGGFYSIWHNTFNSWQLYKQRHKA